MSRRLIRLDEVMRRTGKSRSAIYRDPKLNAAKVGLGPRSTAWIEDEVDAVVDEIIANGRNTACHRMPREAIAAHQRNAASRRAHSAPKPEKRQPKERVRSGTT